MPSNNTSRSDLFFFKADMHETIIRLFNEGKAPSAIDRRLQLIHGTAHDTICAWWEADREKQAHAQKKLKGDVWL